MTKTVDDHVNPSHYKDIIPGYEYMDCMEYMLEGFEGVEAHLLGQTYKYLMRLGKKDLKIQDALKAKWYLDRLVSTIEKTNCNTDGESK
jgi:hypothetical protein